MNDTNHVAMGMCHALARLQDIGCRVREAYVPEKGQAWVTISKPSAGQRDALKPISTRDRLIPGWIVYECEGLGITGAVVRWESRMAREGV